MNGYWHIQPEVPYDDGTPTGRYLVAYAAFTGTVDITGEPETADSDYLEDLYTEQEAEDLAKRYNTHPDEGARALKQRAT